MTIQKLLHISDDTDYIQNYGRQQRISMIVLKPPKYNRINTYNKTKVNITKHLPKRATRNVEMKE